MMGLPGRLPGGEGIMTAGILRRTTFIVPDAARAAQFYESVFSWTRFYDHALVAKAGFPPVGPQDEPVKLVLLKAEDPKIGMVGFLQYVDPPFDTAIPVNRSKVRMGEAILVVQTDDVDGVHRKAVAAGANVCVPPTSWEVPSHDGSSVIRLRTMSMFDPNGIYSEINQHLS
jgi:catechol 2,3-dioxygenase-like lactoylglutathione lyase family enzyme